MIAVTGANGQLGRLVLKHLAKLTDTPVRALVRTPSKAEDLASSRISVVKADYDDPATLRTALEGVDTLLLISGSDIGSRVPQHTAVIEAAGQAGVGFIAYTSILNVSRSSLILASEHAVTERLLADSGVAHALLRNGWYLENFAGTIAGALAHGAVVGASGDGRFSAAAREDYAEAAARVLTGEDRTTRTLELGGRPSFTLAELAAELSSRTGRDIPFTNLPETAYADVLLQAGLPEGFAKVVADADRGAAQGELETNSSDLQEVIGHPSRSLSTFVADTLKGLAATPA